MMSPELKKAMTNDCKRIFESDCKAVFVIEALNLLLFCLVLLVTVTLHPFPQCCSSRALE